MTTGKRYDQQTTFDTADRRHTDVVDTTTHYAQASAAARTCTHVLITKTRGGWSID